MVMVMVMMIVMMMMMMMIVMMMMLMVFQNHVKCRIPHQIPAAVETKPYAGLAHIGSAIDT